MVSTRTGRGRIATMSFYGFVLLLVYLVYQLFEPFLVPLAWAAVLVVFCYPWHARLVARYGKTGAATLSTIAVTLTIIVPSLLVMTAFVREGAQAVGNLEGALKASQLQRVQRGWEWAQQHMLGREPTDLADFARQVTTWAAGFLAAQAGAVLRNLLLFIIDLVVMLFAVFFLFRDADAVMDVVRRALPFEERHRERMIAQARDLVFATMISGMVVATIQGLLGGLTFAALGIDAPIFWGVVMAFFALLPFGGAWVIWGPAAIWLFIAGDVGRALILSAIGAGIVGTVDNFLRPALLSGRSPLNGLLVFISLLGGVAVFGLLGLVLGPIVVSIAAGLLETYTAQD